ncbi:hypothetical protein GCM10027521_63440 [Amycolatopsis cihanbeyliensis]
MVAYLRFTDLLEQEAEAVPRIRVGEALVGHDVTCAELVALPATLSAVDAVTLGISGMVAHFGLRHARFAPGESVLVRGAAGGIGVMAVQLADFAMAMVSAFRKSMSFATFSADTVPEPDRHTVTAELLAATSRGELHAVVHEVLPLEHAVLAHHNQDQQTAAWQAKSWGV